MKKMYLFPWHKMINQVLSSWRKMALNYDSHVTVRGTEVPQGVASCIIYVFYVISAFCMYKLFLWLLFFLVMYCSVIFLA